MGNRVKGFILWGAEPHRFYFMEKQLIAKCEPALALCDWPTWNPGHQNLEVSSSGQHKSTANVIKTGQYGC